VCAINQSAFIPRTDPFIIHHLSLQAHTHNAPRLKRRWRLNPTLIVSRVGFVNALAALAGHNDVNPTAQNCLITPLAVLKLITEQLLTLHLSASSFQQMLLLPARAQLAWLRFNSCVGVSASPGLRLFTPSFMTSIVRTNTNTVCKRVRLHQMPLFLFFLF
jgi:hypothetical protein